jgi:nitrous oxidase accessory protein NosD
LSIGDSAVLANVPGFSLTNTAGPETQALGVYGFGRRDVTVRNGALRGFLTGVKLEEGAQYRVEDILAVGSRLSGLEVCGSDGIVQRNRVVETGIDGAAFGIVACGSMVQVLGNDVLDTLGTEARSVELRDASEALVSANRVGQSTPSTGVGLLVRDSEGVVVKGNRITGVERGIVFERSTGAAVNNVMSGVAVPEEGVQP